MSGERKMQVLAALLGVSMFAVSPFALDANVAGLGDMNLPAPYVAPGREISGTIRIWGHGAYGGTEDFIESLTRAWEAGFRKYHPSVQFETRLTGTAAAIGALYTGVGDLALMGREIWPNEVAAFEEVYHYPPTGVDVVTGSFDVRNRGYAIVLFVQQDNPLRRLTLSQVDAVFSGEHRRSASGARTWGDLGLGGVWKHKEIHLYGLPIARGFAQYFEDTVFESSRIWNPRIQEFADQPGSKGGDTDGGQALLNALAEDPQGIGYAGLLYHNPRVRPLALAAQNSGPYVEPTKDTVLDHSYPLTRKITLFLNRAPGVPVEPKLKEFLRYVLSREGQQAVLREGGGYLPMLAPFAANELDKLENKP
ncbi:MAG TPA: substrate-binding domain-containing protein [Steroidobacteraceae bacterium]|nr:substrate-binding domain-containing protein [Steroidobacteraceae bacterium]